MLSLILAESSLELVPKKIRGHPSVTSHARRLGKKPSEILLDNSWHFAAMKGIDNEIKRGRPDLVHFCLLECCSIPLYWENELKVYVHTIDDKTIFVGEKVRFPKSFHRFTGLIEKLYHDKAIEFENQKLLELKEMNFSELIDHIGPKEIISLSTDGEKNTYQNIATKLNENSCLVLGAFPKGHFSDEIKSEINYSYKTENTSLEAHVVLSRILYEYEKTIFM